MHQYDFYLSSPVKFARPGGDAGESNLIVLKAPGYKHAGAAAALNGFYTEAMFRVRDGAHQKHAAVREEAEKERLVEPTQQEREKFIRMLITADGVISEALINAFIRLVKMPGIASVDGEIALTETHLTAISFDDLVRMAACFLSVFIDRSDTGETND